jgi:hypothetical protein
MVRLLNLNGLYSRCPLSCVVAQTLMQEPRVIAAFCVQRETGGRYRVVVSSNVEEKKNNERATIDDDIGRSERQDTSCFCGTLGYSYILFAPVDRYNPTEKPQYPPER